MEESRKGKFDVETTDNKLDIVLVTALRKHFEIKPGFYTDRNEILDFLRFIISQHPDLGFVLHHRDTKLSGRVYKAFPKVTTKRVAVPNERGKKTWRYTNLRRIPQQTDIENSQAAAVYDQTRDTSDTTLVSRDSVPMNNQSAEYGMEAEVEPTSSPKFSSILKWIRDNFILDKDSSVQVRHIVDEIKTIFNTDITYKQLHKLVFSVFPGVTKRASPVRLEVRGTYFLYQGLAEKTQSKAKGGTDVTHFNSTTMHCNGKPRVNLSRKCFLASCAALKDNLDALKLMKNYEEHASVSEVTPNNDSSWRQMVEELREERDQAIAERNQAMISLMEIEKEQQTDNSAAGETSRDHYDTCRSSDEHDVSQDDSLRDMNGETSTDCASDHQKDDERQSGDDKPKLNEDWRGFSEVASARSEERAHDWLQSLISRSNHILGEQMSQVNNNTNNNNNIRYHPHRSYNKTARYSGEYIEIERYEKLKNERDQIWKSWIEKLRREKDGVIHQLKLEKMEVIQKMELEKCDAIDCIHEKLTNQVTILTRELREVKELLGYTMDERSLAIEHAQKLMKLIDEEVLKENGLDNLPFDSPQSRQHVHGQKTQPSPTTSARNNDNQDEKQQNFSFNKGNKRKQSMPAKLIVKAMKKGTCGDEDCTLENGTKDCSQEAKNAATEQYLYRNIKEERSEKKDNISSIDCLNSIVAKIS